MVWHYFQFLPRHLGKSGKIEDMQMQIQWGMNGEKRTELIFESASNSSSEGNATKLVIQAEPKNIYKRWSTGKGVHSEYKTSYAKKPW